MTYPVLDRQTALDRLYLERSVFENEERLHPWRARPSQSFQKPLLRIWDKWSGSKVTPWEKRMLARDPSMRLDNYKSRQSSLGMHLNHKERTEGPYISFTTSPTAIEILAEMRIRRKRGAQTLSVIDPNSRIRNGLPILDVEAEKGHYNIPDPYKKGNEYYRNHYVCLWQVTEAEIVGQWEWDDLANNENWYQEIMHAFRAFTSSASNTGSSDSSVGEAGTVDSAGEAVDGLGNAFNNIYITTTFTTWIRTRRMASLGYYQCDWDIDDEVEAHIPDNQ
ncbi:hypothetical protein F5Y13DRAFT_181886 [Hypoxylon sp. FL1857]|nr:hypothetical protein F5Y13DRAFT_181886 [Hypoxylon sp. FL1857]